MLVTTDEVTPIVGYFGFSIGIVSAGDIPYTSGALICRRNPSTEENGVNFNLEDVVLTADELVRTVATSPLMTPRTPRAFVHLMQVNKNVKSWPHVDKNMPGLTLMMASRNKWDSYNDARRFLTLALLAPP